MTNRINCEDCKFFEPTGTEWFYVIGNCNHPLPALGGAMVSQKGIAGWLTCYQAKKQRKSKDPARAAENKQPLDERGEA